MKTVGSYEAKTHLPQLLRRVAKGERITITNHGVPVALIVPAAPRTGKHPPPDAGPKRQAIFQPADCERELRWLAEHRQEYAGQWVALDGDRLLAHGFNAREVHAAARRSRGRLPLVTRIEPLNQLPFGGW